MSWEMKLYRVSNDPKTVSKTLGTETDTLQCTPYEAISDIEGFVIVDYNTNRFNTNYASLQGKYYYITGREALTADRLKLYLKCDVLMTYVNTTDFQNLTVYPSRSESAYNSWMMDGRQPYEVAKENVVVDPIGADESLPDACLDYSNLSIIATVVGTDEPTNTRVES